MSSKRDSDAFYEAVTLVQRFVCAFEQGRMLHPPLSGSLPALRSEAERLALEGLLFALARKLDRRGEVSALAERMGLVRAVEKLATRRLRERGRSLERGTMPGQAWVRELAALGWSPATVRRRVGKVLGVSPRELRQRHRIHDAINFIRAGMKIEAAGHECGYRSERAFFAAFRKLTGTTPGAVRELKPGEVEALKHRLLPWGPPSRAPYQSAGL